MKGPIGVAAALAEAARDLRGPQDLGSTLDLIVTAARDSSPSVDLVGISQTLGDGTVVTRAATDDLVHTLNGLPPDLGDTARSLGIRSQLAVQLQADEHTSATLHLYSTSQDALSDEARQLAELFAAHAGLALGHARRLENLNAALTSRKVIGLALGLVMQRFDLDEDTAFAYLTRMSATTEMKLRDVAAELVEQHHQRIKDGTGRNAPVSG